MTRNENLSTIYNAILDGDVTGAQEGVQAVLAADLKPEDFLGQSMIAAMREVGQRFEDGDYYVPEMLVAARAMQANGFSADASSAPALVHALLQVV